MNIERINIYNYRNLGNLEILFSNSVSFFIGENNLGKTNVLHALINILNNRKFEADDFCDCNKSIKFVLSVHLDSDEIGIFEDLCDPNNPQNVDIVVEQEDEDSSLSYKHLQTKQPISISDLKKLLVIDYDSIRNPKNEISFQKTKGAASLLNHLIKKYINDHNEDFLNNSKVKKVEKYINDNLGKIIPQSKYGIKAKVFSKNEDLVSSVLGFKDSNDVDVSKSGYGIQYNVMIILSIFEKIINFLKKKEDISRINALIIMDEPEIHLHPQMQRSLITNLQNICEGNDEGFNSLLKNVFNIDEFRAQLIISTHSPYILNDDYHNVSRFYKDARGQTQVVSAKTLALNKKEENHLYIQYGTIKEAMFARGTLIFEGYSERWSFPGFAKKMNIDFDSYGVTLINANGAESVLPLMKLFEKLEVKAVGIIDKDKLASIGTYTNLYYTNQLCFDSEIVATLIKKGSTSFLEQVVSENDKKGNNAVVQKSALEKYNKKYCLNLNVTSDIVLKDLTMPSLKSEYFLAYVAWFSNNKGALLSNYLSENISVDNIPDSYKKAIKKIYSLVK